MALPQSGSSSTVLIFAEGGKPENPEKNPRSEDENQQQTQPTYDAGSGNRTRATLVGGECSPHCAIPAPQLSSGQKFNCLRLPVSRMKNSLSKFLNLFDNESDSFTQIVVNYVKNPPTYYIHYDLVDKQKNMLNGKHSSILARFDIREEPYEKNS